MATNNRIRIQIREFWSRLAVMSLHLGHENIRRSVFGNSKQNDAPERPSRRCPKEGRHFWRKTAMSDLAIWQLRKISWPVYFLDVWITLAFQRGVSVTHGAASRWSIPKLMLVGDAGHRVGVGTELLPDMNPKVRTHP